MTQEQLINSQISTTEMGKKGEQFALAYERHRLPPFLHGKIVHLGQYEVARGYDILSYEDANSILPNRYIEVKTFRGHPHFHWSDNEIAAARKYGSHYYLYLIDIDRVAEPSYEPTIIPNPATLFNENSQWTFQVQQYAFTLVSNEQIPTDWDSSTILLGCYNNEQHLQWILSHNLYNVRSQKDAPGAVILNNPLVCQARYLILYSVANPRVFMLYTLASSPYKVTKTEMLALGYPNPHAFSYILHPIKSRLDSFHIDLTTLLREVNHQGDNTYGTPLYLNGTQLRRFMVRDANIDASKSPHLLSQENKVATHNVERPQNCEPSQSRSLSKPQSSKQGMLWTPDEDATLLTHLKQHIPISEIAPLLNRTEKAITRRMDRLRSSRVISYDLYIFYYDNDPAFTSHRRFKRFD